MSMCKADLKNAFREVISKEFEFIPLNEEEIDYSFSPIFEKRMSRLIKAQQKFYYSFTNTGLKKTKVICAVLITMFLVACSVEPVRKPIVNFFSEIFNDSIRYFAKGETVDYITEEYCIKSLPDGFVEIDHSKNANEVFYEYKNKLGEQIFFTQMITSSADVSFDAEHGKIYSKKIKDKSVQIYESPYSNQALWIENKYMMHIVCYGKMDIDILEFLIENTSLN